MTDDLTKDNVFDFLRRYVQLDSIQKDTKGNVKVKFKSQDFTEEDNKALQEYIVRGDVKKILFTSKGDVKMGGANQKKVIDKLFTTLKVKKPFGNMRGGISVVEKEVKETQTSKEINDEELRRQQTIF